jgi:hypothetical protein
LFFGGNKKSVEKIAAKKMFRKDTIYHIKGSSEGTVKEDPTASCGCPHAVAYPQPMQGHPKKNQTKGKSVGCFWPGFCFFVGPCFFVLF